MSNTKLGIVSDSHDNLSLVDKAVERLNNENVLITLHAGDYVAPFTVTRFKKLRSKMIGVFGNNDGDHKLLRKKFDEIETAEIRGSFAEANVEGLKIALLHGGGELLQSLINTQYYDVVAHGHTHQAKTYCEGRTLVVNPGEICAYLSGMSTIALLDTETRKATVVRL